MKKGRPREGEPGTWGSKNREKGEFTREEERRMFNPALGESSKGRRHRKGNPKKRKIKGGKT